MPIFYTDTGSFDNLQITSSFVISSSAIINLGSNASTFSGSFTGSFVGSGVGLNSIVVPMFKTTTNSPAVTGTTSNTLMTQSLIPANTFTAGDVVEVIYRAVKTAGTGIPVMRSYLNTTNSLSGATLLATYQAAAGTGLYIQTNRTLVIRGNTTTEVILATSALPTDDTSTTVSSTTTLANNWTVDQYFLIAIQPGNNNDNVRISFYKIFKL